MAKDAFTDTIELTLTIAEATALLALWVAHGAKTKALSNEGRSQARNAMSRLGNLASEWANT